MNRFEAEDYIAKRFFELDEAFKNFLRTESKDSVSTKEENQKE